MLPVGFAYCCKTDRRVFRTTSFCFYHQYQIINQSHHRFLKPEVLQGPFRKLDAFILFAAKSDSLVIPQDDSGIARLKMNEPEIDQLKDNEPNNHGSSRNKACDVVLKQEKRQRQQCKDCCPQIKSFPDLPDFFRIVYDHFFQCHSMVTGAPDTGTLNGKKVYNFTQFTM